MAKKRKKHNPQKRAKRLSNNVRLWSWETSTDSDGTREAHAEAHNGFIWQPLMHEDVRTLIQMTNNWIVISRALCELNGEVWVEQEARSIKQSKIEEFEDIYQDMQMEVLKSVQTRHVIDCGWIIQSFGKTNRIDDEKLPLIYLGEISEERREIWRSIWDSKQETSRIKTAA